MHGSVEFALSELQELISTTVHKVLEWLGGWRVNFQPSSMRHRIWAVVCQNTGNIIR